MRFGVLAAVGWLLIGCTTTDRIALVPAPAAPTPEAQRAPADTIGKSVRGVPIEMMRFGPRQTDGVLVIGGIHGDEIEGVSLAERLIRELSVASAPTTKPIAVIAIANPDGYAERRRTNANGVDVNRNFPARNFKASRRFGAKPLSEPESRALLDAIELVQPRLIISIHSMPDDACNNYDGPGEAIAKRMSAHNGYRVTPTMGYPTPGSLGSFAGIDRKIAVITLELRRGDAPEHIWRENRDAILDALR